jgi:hypothetical protein
VEPASTYHQRIVGSNKVLKALSDAGANLPVCIRKQGEGKKLTVMVCMAERLGHELQDPAWVSETSAETRGEDWMFGSKSLLAPI